MKNSLNVKIDQGFKKLVPPLTPDQRHGLEDSLLVQGCLVPLFAWNGVLVEGHNRKEICDKHRIPYEVRSLEFPDRQHAELWILQHARGRRNLTEDQQVVLADKEAQIRSEIERKVRAASAGKSGGRSRAKEDSLSDKASDKLSENRVSKSKIDTRAEVAKERNVPERKMRMAAQVRKARPELLDQVAAGELSLKDASRQVVKHERLEVMKAKAEAAPHPSLQLWDLIHGDSVIELPKIKKGSCRLVFADPPYNVGIDYGVGKKADLLSADDYVAWSAKWIRGCSHVLSDDGSLWVLISDEYAAEINIELKRAGFTIRSWIKWFEKFGVNVENNFTRSSRHLFHCVKDPRNFVFNIGEWNTRASDRETEYGDKRANPDGRRWDNVWGAPPNPLINRLVGTSVERIPTFPTQLPRALLTPIVLTASDPGDRVLDPFNGSATTGDVATSNGRFYTGIDKSAEYIELAKLRLQGLQRGAA